MGTAAAAAVFVLYARYLRHHHRSGPGQHVRAAGARLSRYLRRVCHGELRAGQLDDARRGVRVHLRDAPGLAAAARRGGGARAVRGLRRAGGDRRRASVRAPRLERLADGHSRARHRRRQRGPFHLRQGTARLPDVLGDGLVRHRRSYALAAASRDSLGRARARRRAALLFVAHARRQGDARSGAEPRRRPPHGHQRAGGDSRRLRPVHRLRRRRWHSHRALVQRALGHGNAVRAQGLCRGHPRRHQQRLGRDARRHPLRLRRGADHGAARLDLHADPHLCAGHRRARGDAQRPLRPRRREESMKYLSFVILAAAFLSALLFTSQANSYYVFVMATLALTAITGIGLNILLGLTGQVSFGHVGFYAIGAYSVAILTTAAKLDFWLALPLAVALSGLVGALLALPALRVRGPYLAMVTIAFGFVVENSASEWKTLTGGQNGIMGVPTVKAFGAGFGERGVALLAIALCALLVFGYWRLSRSSWGSAMRAVKDSEVAAESVGLNPVAIKALAFALSAACAGLA